MLPTGGFLFLPPVPSRLQAGQLGTAEGEELLLSGGAYWWGRWAGAGDVQRTTTSNAAMQRVFGAAISRRWRIERPTGTLRWSPLAVGSSYTRNAKPDNETRSSREIALANLQGKLMDNGSYP
jgi:hypothetical protein